MTRDDYRAIVEHAFPGIDLPAKEEFARQAHELHEELSIQYGPLRLATLAMLLAAGTAAAIRPPGATST